MAVESATYPNALDPTLPLSGDGLAEGDNHIRLLKTVIKTTFPNLSAAVTKTAAQINNLIESTASLAALAALTPAADKLAYFTNGTTAALATVTTYGRTLLALADAAAGRTALGLAALATKATVATADIDPDAVTFAKLQNIATSRLLGRTTASSGDVEELTVGAGLTLSGGVLAANSLGLLHVQDQKTSGTDSGTFNSGSFVTRTINTVVSNSIAGSSLSSNQVTLPAGTYVLEGALAVANVNWNKAKLRNITDGVDTLLGLNNYNNASNDGHAPALVSGAFTIAAQKVFELQHRCSATRSTEGFGLKASYGINEVFLDVKFWKIA